MISAESFIYALNRLKKEKGISPVKFAADVGLTYDVVNNIRRGRSAMTREQYEKIEKKMPQILEWAREFGVEAGREQPADNEEMKKMLDDMRRWRDEYVIALIEENSALKARVEAITDKYMSLLEQMKGV